MKNLLLILSCFLSIVFFSCNFHSDLDQIEKKISTELETGQRHDTIFLGLRFGMTEVEVLNELEKLYKEGRIDYLDKKSNERFVSLYRYKFYFGESVFHALEVSLYDQYYNDSLYRFTLLADSKSMYPLKSKLKLKEVYERKYGAYLQKKSTTRDYDYVWVNGNRMIEIESIGKTGPFHIVYTDLIAKAKKEKKEALDAKLNAKKVEQDI